MKLRQYALIVILGLVAGIIGGTLSGWIFMAKSGDTIKSDIEKIKLYLQVGSIALLAFSIYVSARLVRKQIATTQQWNRRKSAFDVAASYTEKIHEHSLKLNEVAEVNFSDIDQTCETVKNEENSGKVDYNLGCMLALFEEVALGIRVEILDNDIAYDLLNLILLDLYPWGKPYIDHDRKYFETAYINVEQLYEKWQAKSKEVS